MSRISEYLKKNKLIADGAFGTYYMSIYEDQEEENAETAQPEKANILYPDRVVNIHKEYIESGAGLIRTNTFAAHKVSLNTDIEGVQENVRAAVANVRKAIELSDVAADKIFIAGSIGPV
ncbi:MAG: homocysteine S-methyltransferase family protein, partial [Coprococcus sp.]